jgi:hypothetical protein
MDCLSSPSVLLFRNDFTGLDLVFCFTVFSGPNVAVKSRRHTCYKNAPALKISGVYLPFLINVNVVPEHHFYKSKFCVLNHGLSGSKTAFKLSKISVPPS